LVKLAALASEHTTDAARSLVLEGLTRATSAGIARHLRWWLRRSANHLEWIVQTPNGLDAVLAVGELDPEGWRQSIAANLSTLRQEDRRKALDFIRRHAARNTTAALATVGGADVAEVRRILVNRQAQRIFIRSFGSLSVHKGAWDGPRHTLEKRRIREFLGLLVANFKGALTRDVAIEAMWPDADPAAAVNSLNQTVFQLRRVLDPGYRDGESPQYVVSTGETLSLNPDLVTTDLDEFRRCAADLQHQGLVPLRKAVNKALDLIRGEFLPELRYQDWAARLQTRVHAEVRNALLPLAIGDSVGSDVGVRAASALLEIDPFDEIACVAIADQLGVSGKRAKARDVIVRFAQQLQEELDEPPSSAVQAALARWAGVK